jgi:hypothetical protein
MFTISASWIPSSYQAGMQKVRRGRGNIVERE